jgi:hypothetical protein
MEPRSPTAAEVYQLIAYKARQARMEPDAWLALGRRACIAVFDDYCTDQLGYRGKIMLVVWGSSPRHYELYLWQAGQLSWMPAAPPNIRNQMIQGGSHMVRQPYSQPNGVCSFP